MKNKSKYFIYILLVVSLSAVITSCKKILQIPAAPPNTLGANRVYADSASAIGAMAGIYSDLIGTQYFGSVLSINDGGTTVYTALTGDELSTTSTDANITMFFNNKISPSNTDVAQMWADAYTTLYQVNDALTQIPASAGITPTLKQQLTGELETIRALYYFNMVNLFGDVPLVTNTNYKVTSLLPRTPAVDIYTQIIADLTDAEKKLGASYPSDDRFRPNRYVAAALLAKVYLYQKQWKNAADMASLVINQTSTYQLDDLSGIFLAGATHMEPIWRVPNTGGNDYYGVIEAVTLLPTPDAGVFPTYLVTPSLRKSFEKGDQRALNWINSMHVPGDTTTYYYAYKYKAYYQSSTSPASQVEDYSILRLGEQYLIRAEANAELGLTDDAITDMNVIRHRAKLNPYAGPKDQASVLAAIMHERQVELMCEWGNRWFDLKRTGTIDTVLGSEKAGWKNTDALFPIPQGERQLNPNLTQNPGY